MQAQWWPRGFLLPCGYEDVACGGWVGLTGVSALPLYLSVKLSYDWGIKLKNGVKGFVKGERWFTAHRPCAQVYVAASESGVSQ